MPASPYNLSQFNSALMSMKWIDHSALRTSIVNKGSTKAKPLNMDTFRDLLIPSEFVSQKSWCFTYQNHKGKTPLAKLMRGISEGISVHRITMTELAEDGFGVTMHSDHSLMDALNENSASFLERYASESSDMKQCLHQWICFSHEEFGEDDRFNEIISILEYDEKISESQIMSAILLMGMITGFFSGYPALFHAWERNCISWLKAGGTIAADEELSDIVKRHFTLQDSIFRKSYFHMEAHKPIEDMFVPLAQIENDTHTYTCNEIQKVIPEETSFVFITGKEDSGSDLFTHMLLSSLVDKGQIALQLNINGNDNLLAETASALSLERIYSWHDLKRAVKRKITIFLERVQQSLHRESLLTQILEASKKLSGLDLQFVMAYTVPPYVLLQRPYQLIQVLPYTDEQIDSILQNHIDSNTISSLKHDPLFWRLLHTPLNLKLYCEQSRNESLPHHFSMRPVHTSVDLMYNWLLHFTDNDPDHPLHDQAFIYLAPALAFAMYQQNSYHIGISYVTNTLFSREFHHLVEHRLSTFRKSDIPLALNTLESSGIIQQNEGLYEFTEPVLRDFLTAMHAYNLSDIVIKENVQIDDFSDYDECAGDFYYHFYTKEVLKKYHRISSCFDSKEIPYSFQRLLSIELDVLLYGNGYDIKGMPMSADSFEESVERFRIFQACWSKVSAWPLSLQSDWTVWDYAYYAKRMADEICSNLENQNYMIEIQKICDISNPEEYAQELYVKGFKALQDRISSKEEEQLPVFAGLYDKRAQFLLTFCPPLHHNDDDTWTLPDNENCYTKQNILEMGLADLKKAEAKNYYYAFNRHADLYQKRMIDGNGNISLTDGIPDYNSILELYKKSALFKDRYAIGMVGQIIIDHYDEIHHPVHLFGMPYDLESDSVIDRYEYVKNWILYDTDETLYQSLVAEARKTRYGTLMHLLARCEIAEAHYEDAYRLLEAVSNMSWVENLNQDEPQQIRIAYLYTTAKLTHSSANLNLGEDDQEYLKQAADTNAIHASDAWIATQLLQMITE